MASKVDFEKVQRIMSEIIETIDTSKNKLLDIVENAREEYELLSKELNEIKIEMDDVIAEVDRLTIKDRLVRNHLAEVSKAFNSHSELDIKKAYEKATAVQVDLISAEKEEQMLRRRRTTLEISLKRSLKNIKNAEHVVQQVTVAVTYLKGEILSTIDEAGNEEMFYGLKLLEAQENERTRISRDLHDGPAQFIASVVMKAELCEKIAHKDMDKGLLELAELKQLSRKALKEVRDIIHDLRPMSLDDLGLPQAIEAFVFEAVKETEIKAQVKSGKPLIEIEPIVKVAVYRLVQELMNNVIKHSAAKHVMVTLEFGTQYLRITVSDNGIGFNIESTIESLRHTKKSYGLLGIYERVGQLKGKVKYHSVPYEGTTVTIQLPVNREVIQSE